MAEEEAVQATAAARQVQAAADDDKQVSDADSGSESEASGKGSAASESSSGSAGGSGSGSGSGSESDSDDGFVAGRRRRRGGGGPAKRVRRAAAAAPVAKKKRAAARDEVVRRYFEDVAEEDEDADEDEEGGGRRRSAKKEMTVAEEVAAAEAVAAREREASRRARERRNAVDSNMGAYIKGLEERADEYFEAAEAEERGYDVDTAGAPEDAWQQANLPDMRDPKLWMMRCKEGAEAEIMIALVNKYIARAEAGDRLGIMSAVNTAKGIIFVESFREAQVRAAVLGITDLYGWKPDAIKLVPIGQMTSVLRVHTTRAVFKRGMWVRLTRGQYKGDLAEVVDVYEAGSRILIRAVPRINLTLLGLPKEQRRGARGRGGARPPQRYFDRAEVMDAANGQLVIEPRSRWGLRFDSFGGNMFRDGMLYKEVKPAFVTPYGPAPSVDELGKFRPLPTADAADGGHDGKPADATEDALSKMIASTRATALQGGTAPPGSGDEHGRLAPGDSVIVVKGDLTNLTGRVVSVNPGGTFTLQPSAESAEQLGMNERLEIPTDEVIKTFEIGDHVKVNGGAYNGETGTVLDTRLAAGTDTWLAVLLLDSGYKTVEAFVRDLSRSTEVVTSTVSSIEGYELRDLVEIPGVTEAQPQAGVIVGLGQRDVQVLLVTGTVRTMPVQQLRGKMGNRGDHSTAIDYAGHGLAVGDVVRVIEGDFKDTVGTIKHIYKAFLFLHNFMRTAQAGMFVVRSRYTMLAGTKSRTGTDQAMPVTAGGLGGGSARGRGRGRGRGQDDIIGKTVRLLRGRWKNMIGIAKTASDKNITVELHSSQKNLAVLRSEVVVVGDRHGAVGGGMGKGGSQTPFALGGATPYIGGQTPHIGSATPAFGAGGQTPNVFAGGATPNPYAGAATPQYAAGSQTPMYGFGSQTPMYGANAYGAGGSAAGSRTPSYGATAAPAYAPGSRTPMYGMAGAQTPTQFPSSSSAFAAPPPSAVQADDADVPWYAPGVKVDIIRGNTSAAGQVGVIRAVNAGACMVNFPSTGMITVTVGDLQPRPPQPQQACRILAGDFAGARGMCVSIDENDVIVRVGAEDKIEIVPLSAVVLCE